MTVVHSMTIFEQFEKLSLSTNEQAVANYILQNSSSAVTMSIKELANAAFTSTTTIIRLCKKLGFHGYKEFKIQLSKDVSFEMVKEFPIDVNAPFSVEDTSVINISDHHIACTNVFRHRRCHNTNRACTRNQHIFAHQIKRQRGMHGVTEGIKNCG